MNAGQKKPRKKYGGLRCFAGVIFILFSFVAHAQVWEEQLSYDGRFRILTPATMEEKVDSIETAIGAQGVHTFYHQAPETDENRFYMVQYYDFPENAMHSDSTALLEDFFAATIEEAAVAVKGEVRYSREDQVDGYPGRYWRIDYLDEKVVIKTRAFLVDNRYYSIQVIMTRDQSLNKTAERFLDSFDLL